MAKQRKRNTYEFKPDAEGKSLLQRLHLTRLQRLTVLRWLLYALVCLVLLVVQDVIMSRVHFWGAATDLVPMAILLIAVIEDSDNGGLFALLASTFYELSGSAPGPYVIAFLTIFAIIAAIFRQLYWRRSFTSNVLCAGVALMAYEIAVFGIGLFLGLTYFSRIGVFLLTGLISWALMLALYPLIRVIGKIGGELWRE